MKQDSSKALAKNDAGPASRGETSQSNLEELKYCSEETSVSARKSDWETVKDYKMWLRHPGRAQP